MGLTLQDAPLPQLTAGGINIDPDGMNIGMRHISLSTCGLVKKIDKLAQLGLQLTLSVSLHAPLPQLTAGGINIASQLSPHRGRDAAALQTLLKLPHPAAGLQWRFRHWPSLGYN